MHPRVALFRSEIFQTESHVFSDGQMREKGKILEKQADKPFFGRNVIPSIGQNIIVPSNPAGLQFF